MREGAGLIRVGEQRGGSLRQREAGLVDKLGQGHALLLGVEPLVRLAGEGREDAPPGSSGEAGPGAEEQGLEARVREDQAPTHTLETEQELILGKGQLQEEVERLRQEVTSQRTHIQQLNSQLEERTTGAEELREVLVSLWKGRFGGLVERVLTEITIHVCVGE